MLDERTVRRDRVRDRPRWLFSDRAEVRIDTEAHTMIITKAELSRAPEPKGRSPRSCWPAPKAIAITASSGRCSRSPDDAKRDFLFREIEPGAFIIVSNRAPEDPHGLWTSSLKTYAPALAAGDRLGFVLRANPAMAVPQPGQKRGHARRSSSCTPSQSFPKRSG